METIKQSIVTVINSGNYNAERLCQKIDTLWLSDSLTDEERAELTDLAYNKAKDFNQIDFVEKLTSFEHELQEIENRVYAIEHKDDPEPEPVPEYVIYYSGYVTSKGETVMFDYDNDGELDLLRYDGGKSQTSLSPGKITGWHVVDSEGNILGTYYKGEFTPVEPEPEPAPEPEPEPEPEVPEEPVDEEQEEPEAEQGE